MTSEELIQLAQWILEKKAETQTLEIKSAQDGCPRRLYDTLSSFSNQDQGGILFFGIDESQDFALVGVYDLQKLQKGIVEQCEQMDPIVRAVFTVAEIDGKDICAAEIPGIDLSRRPCFYRGAGRLKGAYLRIGDADKTMTEYELYSFEAFRRHLHDDERVVPRALLEDLVPEKLNLYLAQRTQQRPGFANLPKQRILELLGISREDKPTLAAILNFAVYPQGFFPQLCITAVVVPGTQMAEQALDGARFLDTKRIEGTLPELVDGALAFCRHNLKTRLTIDAATGERKDTPEYPMVAIREALLNAVVHRDYSQFTEGTPVQLLIFADRLEIHSPGTLYGRMTVEQLGYARPDLRNPVLATMMEALTKAENRYSGIPTMRRAMEDAHLPAPKFENRRNEFVVTFYGQTTDGAPALESMTGTETICRGLLEFCKVPRTRKEIAGFLKLTSISYITRKYLHPLLVAHKLAETIPEKPRSKNQRYYTTTGNTQKAVHNQGV